MWNRVTMSLWLADNLSKMAERSYEINSVVCYTDCIFQIIIYSVTQLWVSKKWDQMSQCCKL